MFQALCAHHQVVKILLYSIWYHHTCRWPSRGHLHTCNWILYITVKWQHLV